MARRYTFAVPALIAALLTAGGCTSGTNTAGLPRPTFTGPVVAKPAYTPPTAVSVAATPRPPSAKPTRADVPAAWVPSARAEKRRWDFIVIHHSATSAGGVAAFDRMHKAKGWDGVGYHFVIGNGTDTADGQIEVSPRWPVQKHGAHAKTPDNRYNDHGIGVCLVGNFDQTRPTAKQTASLNRLVAHLADAYRVKPANILGHKMTGKSTDCPGTYLDVTRLRADVGRLRRAAVAEGQTTESGEELIRTASR